MLHYFRVKYDHLDCSVTPVGADLPKWSISYSVMQYLNVLILISSKKIKNIFNAVGD